MAGDGSARMDFDCPAPDNDGCARSGADQRGHRRGYRSRGYIPLAEAQETKGIIRSRSVAAACRTEGRPHPHRRDAGFDRQACGRQQRTADRPVADAAHTQDR